jgi:hypothetical protein
MKGPRLPPLVPKLRLELRAESVARGYVPMATKQSRVFWHSGDGSEANCRNIQRQEVICVTISHHLMRAL